MQRDEDMARQMAGLDVGGQGAGAAQRPGRIRGGAGDPAEFDEAGNLAGRHINANFLAQAREVLTANYQNADVAARGLLAGWLTGRENPLPAGAPGDLDQQMAQQQQQGQLDPLQPRSGRRRTYRMRHAGTNS